MASTAESMLPKAVITSDRGFGPHPAKLADQLDAAAPRHPDVREHRVEVDLAREVERVGRRGRFPHLEAAVAEQGAEHLAHRHVVVDHQQRSLRAP